MAVRDRHRKPARPSTVFSPFTWSRAVTLLLGCEPGVCPHHRRIHRLLCTLLRLHRHRGNVILQVPFPNPTLTHPRSLGLNILTDETLSIFFKKPEGSDPGTDVCVFLTLDLSTDPGVLTATLRHLTNIVCHYSPPVEGATGYSDLHDMFRIRLPHSCGIQGHGACGRSGSHLTVHLSAAFRHEFSPHTPSDHRSF